MFNIAVSYTCICNRQQVNSGWLVILYGSSSRMRQARQHLENMADSVGERNNMDYIRETDLNGDIISGAIGTNATTSLEEDDPQQFPRMDEMIKVATDLQWNTLHSGDESARLEFESSGENDFRYLCYKVLEIRRF